MGGMSPAQPLPLPLPLPPPLLFTRPLRAPGEEGGALPVRDARQDVGPHVGQHRLQALPLLGGAGGQARAQVAGLHRRAHRQAVNLRLRHRGEGQAGRAHELSAGPAMILRPRASPLQAQAKQRAGREAGRGEQTPPTGLVVCYEVDHLVPQLAELRRGRRLPHTAVGRLSEGKRAGSIR